MSKFVWPGNFPLLETMDGHGMMYEYLKLKEGSSQEKRIAGISQSLSVSSNVLIPLVSGFISKSDMHSALLIDSF